MDTLVMVKVISTSSPTLAFGGTTTPVTCRSAGGGVSISSGCSAALLLLSSRPNSITRPLSPAPQARAGSVTTKT
jgi:hypothetical protein